MKQFIVIFIFTFYSVFAHAAENNDSAFYFNSDVFFRKYVWDGKVDYAEIIKNRNEVDSLLKQIAAFNTKVASKNKLKSFYFNAYHILLIKCVIDHYPLSSIREINGLFDLNKYNVGGVKLSLNQLKYNKLSKPDNDIGVLLLLSDASAGGPLIRNVALMPGKKLNKRLNLMLRSMLDNPLFMRQDDKNKAVFVSQLFKWYETEINESFTSLVDFLNQYRSQKIPADYSIIYLDYDWTLNDLNEKYVRYRYAPIAYSVPVPVKRVSTITILTDSVKLIYADTLIPDISAFLSKRNRADLFNEELGFRNESRYIESKTFEIRITDKFYSQTDYYNKQLLRVTNDHLTTYNNVALQGTYAFNSNFQGGLFFSANKLHNNYKKNAAAKDFFGVAPEKTFRVSELHFFSKYKLVDKKYRLTTLLFFSVPLVNRRPTDKVAINNKTYDLSLQALYAQYPVSFMQMILSTEFKLHYSIAKENSWLDFNPSGRFIFTLFRSRPIKLSAIMDLLFSYNKEKTNPFVTIESIAANIRLCYNLDCNLMYQYYALGKNTGAGNAVKIEFRYAFQ